MREKMGKERKKRGGKKLQKEEMAWLTQNTRFDKSNINAWHKVRKGIKAKKTSSFQKLIIF